MEEGEEEEDDDFDEFSTARRYTSTVTSERLAVASARVAARTPIRLSARAAAMT